MAGVPDRPPVLYFRGASAVCGVLGHSGYKEMGHVLCPCTEL